MTKKGLITFDSIGAYHKALHLPKPQHPLVSIMKYTGKTMNPYFLENKFVYDFYNISIKKNIKGTIRYGRQNYDFSEGIMSLSSPKQVFSFDESTDVSELSGWGLIFHADFIRNSNLAKQIKNYGFFSYETHEALHLSEKEEAIIEMIMKNIEQEYFSTIDTFSQDVMISHIELLLNYANRFYNRQFITRKHTNDDLLIRIEGLLKEYFDTGKVQQLGLPTVKYLSFQLNVSPNYLSDMLRIITGKNTQQHIHTWVIEKAKEKLATTSMSVNEIAIQLGFEYPQYFSRLFKTKTKLTPKEFRNSFE
ncbi:helix-turn-helix domain-containing protein [Leptospira brenneri]|uniref:AraC family transcriptional regulator n=1 Tax=Leptospira brenneri TaxID=2023182 RepID=A0A2M9Y4B4_9LEPT|nr:helix-turn-helix transcriptional regulator [Leptospira brenneri]PJZ46405.1 AraC family transcriptional regulator [Leptospira brenneri]TGK96508.1 AraC family transcriptional regulator [Leptospira brenneri]